MKNEAFSTLNHCVYRLRYHLVLVVKYRQPAITPEILSRLKGLTHERAEAWGGEVLEVNGEPDHLHILLELPPTACLSDFVNALIAFAIEFYGLLQPSCDRITYHISLYTTVFIEGMGQRNVAR